MLKFFRKRRTTATFTGDVAEALQIRNLLDDPRLQAVMGLPTDEHIVDPTPLFSHEPIVKVGMSFGRRQLIDHAA